MTTADATTIPCEQCGQPFSLEDVNEAVAHAGAFEATVICP